MTYPALDLNVLMHLQPIREQIDLDPEWLNKNDCPYGADIRAALRLLFPPRIDGIGHTGQQTGTGKRGRKAKVGELSDDQAQVIEEEAMALLAELKGLKAPTGKGMDHDTKIQIIKAKTMLIEKVINMQERAHNVRKVATFQKVVIDILTDIVDPDRINEFQERLGAYL